MWFLLAALSLGGHWSLVSQVPSGGSLRRLSSALPFSTAAVSFSSFVKLSIYGSEETA